MNSNRVIGSIILEGAVTAEDSVIIDGKSSKRVQAQATLQDLDVVNRNRRIYAKADMAPEINGPRMQELIKAKSMLGECGHPLSDDLVRQQTIDPKLACVRFNKIWLDGNLVKSIFQGTNNAYGQEVDDDLRDGVLPAFSLRALGSIENIDGKAYVKNIKVITYDKVIYPSHKRAYTEKIVSEAAISGEPIQENQIVVPENDPGTIITLKESDARTVINRLQRESANLSNIIEALDGIYDNITLVNENTLLMTSRYGEKVRVNLEDHISNVIMDYVWKM